MFDHGKAMLPAEFIIEPLQNPCGILQMEFSCAVEVGTVKFDVAMDVGFVNVGTDHELMLSTRQLHGQLVGNLMGLLRRDLAGFERLDDSVHDNVAVFGLAAPGKLVIKPFADLKFLGGGFRGTHIGRYEVAVLGFLRFLIVFVPLNHRLAARPVPHRFSRTNI